MTEFRESDPNLEYDFQLWIRTSNFEQLFKVDKKYITIIVQNNFFTPVLEKIFDLIWILFYYFNIIMDDILTFDRC